LPSSICVLLFSVLFIFSEALQSILFEIGVPFSYHGYGSRRANLCTYATSFAVFQVYPNWDSFADYSIRTIKPALETGGLILLCRQAFLLIDHRTRAAPLARFTCFPNARR
jgi:hypothetical protein